MTTYNINSIPVITNLLDLNSMATDNVTVSNGVAIFPSGVLAMLTQYLPKPAANHKYYGRCLQARTAGSTEPDARFEYYCSDVDQGLMTFGDFSSVPRDGEYHLTSEILSLSAPIDGQWKFRAFTNQATGIHGRKEFVLIDLTTTFGAGKEPSKVWCDINIPYFEHSLFVPIPTLKPGDIVNCSYNGAENPFLISKGIYKLECWGAKGGTAEDSYTKEGGNGGYSYGEYSAYKQTVLYLNAGQRGQQVGTSTSTFTRAYNGGGKGNRIFKYLVNGCAAGGGGATHIALRSGALKNLSSYKNDIIIVAGGGGGGYDRGLLAPRVGGAGGGLSGNIGEEGQSDSAGTQTTAGPNAGFGYGADTGNDGDTYRGGAGGGGWYGGGAGYDNTAAGSGGSGYIADVTYATNTIHLFNAGTTIEDTSTNPDSSQNGYIRITVIDVFNTDISARVDGAYKNTDGVAVNIGGTWKPVEEIYTKINSAWIGYSTMLKNKVLNHTVRGYLSGYNGSYITPFIELPSGCTRVTIDSQQVINGDCLLEYDANKNYVSYWGGGANPRTFDLDGGTTTRYVRCSFSMANLSQCSLYDETHQQWIWRPLNSYFN